MRLSRDLLLGTSATGAMIAAGVPVMKAHKPLTDPYQIAADVIRGHVASDAVRVVGKSPALGAGYADAQRALNDIARARTEALFDGTMRRYPNTMARLANS